MKELEDITNCEKPVKSMFYGSIVVIKRTGGDGSVFPVYCEESLLGRDEACDIRVQLPQVSRKHCLVVIGDNKKVSSL
jgi:antigen KI-67